MGQDTPVQDIPIPEQDIVVEEQELPQTNLEPEMGAAAAAVYDISPPPLRQNPPILAESAQLSAPDIAQLCAMLAGLNAKMEGMENNMKNEMDGNAWQMERKMDGMAQTMREEMQCMGAGLRGGLEQVKIGNGELLRATCWASTHAHTLSQKTSPFIDREKCRFFSRHKSKLYDCRICWE